MDNLTLTQNSNPIAEKMATNYNNANKNKVFAVMLFKTEIELGISDTPNKWVNTKNQFFNNGFEALEYYANTPCPASQLIDAFSKEELIQKMNQMIINYNNIDWLNNNLYPYL